MDQAVLDYHLLGTTRSQAGDVTHRVVLAAAYREPIDHLVAAFRAAKIELLGIDVEAFALLRAVAPSRPEDPWLTATRSVRLSSPLRSVTTDRRSQSRTERSATSLECSSGAGSGSTSRSAASSVSRKRKLWSSKLGVDLRDGDWGADDGADPRLARARDAVKKELLNLARELIASLQFYQGQPGSHAIGEILVTGGTTRMPGFVEELRAARACTYPYRRSSRRGAGRLSRDRHTGRPCVARGGNRALESRSDACRQPSPPDARVSTTPFAGIGSGLSARRTVQVGGAVTLALAALFVVGYIHERSVVHHEIRARDRRGAPRRRAGTGRRGSFCRDPGHHPVQCGERRRLDTHELGSDDERPGAHLAGGRLPHEPAGFCAGQRRYGGSVLGGRRCGPGPDRVVTDDQRRGTVVTSALPQCWIAWR